MSVIIRGMEKPTACRDCALLDIVAGPYGDGLAVCAAMVEDIDQLARAYALADLDGFAPDDTDTVPDWCPMEETRRGRWIQRAITIDDKRYLGYECSICGCIQNPPLKICPKCKSDMDMGAGNE